MVDLRSQVLVDVTGKGFCDLLLPPFSAPGEGSVHLPYFNLLSCVAQMTSLHTSTEKGLQDMATLAIAANPAPACREAKSPWTKGLPMIWLPKGYLDLAICSLLCPYPRPTSLSLPRLRLLTFLNWLQKRDVNTATGNTWFQAPPSLGIFRLFFLLLAKKFLKSFKFGFLLSWKLEGKVSQSVMVKEKTGKETGTLQLEGGLWS